MKFWCNTTFSEFSEHELNRSKIEPLVILVGVCA